MFGATTFGERLVVISGGQAPHHPALNTAELFDFVGGKAAGWVSMPNMRSFRCRHVMIPIVPPLSDYYGSSNGSGSSVGGQQQLNGTLEDWVLTRRPADGYGTTDGDITGDNADAAAQLTDADFAIEGGDSDAGGFGGKNEYEDEDVELAVEEAEREARRSAAAERAAERTMIQQMQEHVLQQGAAAAGGAGGRGGGHGRGGRGRGRSGGRARGGGRGRGRGGGGGGWRGQQRHVAGVDDLAVAAAAAGL